MLESSQPSLRFLGITLSVFLAGCVTVSSAFAQSSLFQDDETSWVRLVQVSQSEQPGKAAELPSNNQPSPSLPSSSRSRSRNFRPKDSLTRAPAMMGDLYGGGIPFFAFVPSFDIYQGFVPIGSGRSKIAENGKPLPMDRVFLGYNHYVNASTYSTPAGTSSVDVDQYTFGVEKTFMDGLWSAEVRMPLTSDLSIDADSTSIEGGNVGNMTLNLKSSLYRSSDTSMVGGLGITFPTGSDASYVNTLGPFNNFTVRNEAFHLLPFVGFLKTPDDRFFYQAYLQLDIAANGNTIDRFGVTDKLYEANLLHLDLQGGYWLYQDRSSEYFQAAAFLLELHEMSVLRASDTAGGGTPFGNLVTSGFGLQLDLTKMTALRIGGVFPLTQDQNGFFDGEFTAQLNVYF